MTIKEYRELEAKTNEEIKKLQGKLVEAEKEVKFNIPFSVLMEELQKHMFVKNKHNRFCAMIDPNILYMYKDNIKGAVEAEIRENHEKSVFAYIECCDHQNRVRCSFVTRFDMSTKLADGTYLVDALKLNQEWTGLKRVTMDEKDVQKVIIDMSPSGKNYKEIPLEGFVDSLVERMENQDKANKKPKIQRIAEIIEGVKQKKIANGEGVKLDYTYSETEKTLEEHHYTLSQEEMKNAIKKSKNNDNVM